MNSKFSSWSLDRFRFFSLIASIFLYALFSSPTPDRPGLPEIIIGGLLILSAGTKRLWRVMTFKEEGDFYRGSSLLLLYGLSIPVIVGVWSGNDWVLVVRDIIPFLFLMLPIFYADLFKGTPDRVKVLLIAICALGFLFAIRAMLQLYEDPILFLQFLETSELTYFANMPTVLFASLFILGVGAQKFVEHFDINSVFLFVISVVIAALIALPIALSLQRASLGYMAFYGLSLSVVGLYFYPKRAFILLVPVLCIAVFYMGEVLHLWNALITKTSQVGFNMRYEEWVRVWEEVSDNPVYVLFGAGWGADFISPATSGVRVNFTHNLFSSMLLKAGVVGCLLAGLYFYCIVKYLSYLFSARTVLFLCFLGPLFIDMFLYASFKSFDFGLLLLGIVVYSNNCYSEHYIESDTQHIASVA
jgi:hypothetical protein